MVTTTSDKCSPSPVVGVDAIDSQLRKIEGQSLGYKVARFFGLLGR